MTPTPAQNLTKRQQAVMERIDRRMPIKLIAQDLGVSETRINQHIRALKDHFRAGNLGDLVEEYRKRRAAAGAGEGRGPAGARKAANGEVPRSDRADGNIRPGLADRLDRSVQGRPSSPLSETAYSKKQVPEAGSSRDEAERDEASDRANTETAPTPRSDPRTVSGEPRVVPGVLDGEHAVLFRLGAIVGIASGMLAAIVLTLTAAVAISESLDGVAAIPVDERRPS